MKDRLELVCPAGTPGALRAAVTEGADAIYCGFRDATNARNFPGLNFSPAEMAEGIGFAHAHGAKVLVAVNTYPRAGQWQMWRQAVDSAVAMGADAVILADLGLIDYAAGAHPALRLHLSVQASASNAEAINFFVREFGIKRVVLPRVLTIEDIRRLHQQIAVELEVFVFGGMCVMAEGRCSLSSYATGQSPNMNGVCSPACAVRYDRAGDELVTRVGGFCIDRVRDGQPTGYPTICKGRYFVRGEALHLFEEPASLNALGILPRLAEAGVCAVKIEGRQRSRAYVTEVVRQFRAAIDGAENTIPAQGLQEVSEGGRQSEGAYRRSWR